jgi:hypothetical protein
MKHFYFSCIILMMPALLIAQNGKHEHWIKQINRQCAVGLLEAEKLKPDTEKEFEDTAIHITRGLVRQFSFKGGSSLIEKKFTRDSVCIVTETYMLRRGNLIRYTSSERCKYFSEILKTSDTYYFREKKLFGHLRSRDGYVKEVSTEYVPVRTSEGNFIMADCKWWLAFLKSKEDFAHFDAE